MIDAKIEHGDTVVDSSGNVVMISDSDALFQRAVMCISAKLGSFIYDRKLGSRLAEFDLTVTNAKGRAEVLANEALADFEDTYAEVLELGDKLKLKITIDGESRTEEVRLGGNI